MMRVPDRFDLDLTVRSHGFYDLAPWQYDADRRVLARPLRLSTGRVVRAEVAEGPGGLLFRVLARGRPGAAEAAEARGLLRGCLALDDDLSGFRGLAEAAEARRAAGRAKDLPDLRWALSRGAGRLLRSPTAWEDAVKTLCTTNCSWSLTRSMVARLCGAAGDPVPGGSAAGPGGERTFPTAEALAARPERFFRDTVRAGYRAPFLRSLAREVASGRLDLERWRASPPPGPALRAAILELDGFGPYAAEHLARLLGRYDYPALDSWTREKLRALRGMRRPPAEATVRRWYAPYGAWAGLAMWLEVTADWFGERPAWP
jgi:3-methyladenine DNA glycosylase/8-oxoguanine DNA glycosylase